MKKKVCSQKEVEVLNEKETRKEKIKNILTKVGVGAAVVGAGFVGYEIGRRAGVTHSAMFVKGVFEENPELEEPFVNASRAFFEKHSK